MLLCNPEYAQPTTITSLPIVDDASRKSACPHAITRGFKSSKKQPAGQQAPVLPGDPGRRLPIRPLTVVELTANLERAKNDCVFGADPWPALLEEPRVGADVPASYRVTVCQGKPLQDLCTCASLNEVSRLFDFTEDQHRAFSIVAGALLESLVIEDADAISGEDVDDLAVARYQQLLLLHGMGGSGKSYIIQGLLALAITWGRPSSVGTFALTGVAAINVLGETIASLLYYFSKTGVISESMRIKLEALRVLVLDEMSMIQHTELAKLSKLFRKITRRNLPFGGLTLMLAGDFAQLPPVGGPCLFANAKNNEGYDLYRTICSTATVVLNQVLSNFNDFKTVEFLPLFPPSPPPCNHFSSDEADNQRGIHRDADATPLWKF